MAVELVATIQNYQGLSTDTKPMNPAVGSTFRELDTRRDYAFTADGWELNTPAFVAVQDTDDWQDQMLDALERIQQQLGQINNGNNLAPGERFE